ncbi:glycosyltransferase family 2 protein [Paenibacillus sp. RRE4]|uniref:glycosyltransferase family 2 protein n=1 Tax=Paenibacillus sp. RRE4 TaxID=2962587 RepID=UPI002882B727|nr:glycosyltransferase family 2 protein [Paenibacillus sp. RRE4]MDT0126496.1 glycosyltransferase family 2 protein [Paenibacillus sp. RRE4]
MKKAEIQSQRARKNTQSSLQQSGQLRVGTQLSGSHPHRMSTPAKVFLHAAGGRNRRNASRKGKRSHRILRNTKLYKQGYNRGYEDGVLQGQNSFGIVFEGVSIIIPTYNQRDYVLQCVSSIEKYTPAPYEIIVVDNASQDGTADALLRKGGMVRVAALDKNRGFAGGVNQGLMMAKGRHIVVLNNDTLVTPGWLENMMSCLNSDPQIGVVGPVTNYIGGDQQIEVPYREVEEMWSFAANQNRPDPEKHRLTERLVGFCWLFSRDLFERAGYLDEGYAVGNFEDDDWIVRVRMLGYRLAVAGDAFIHHFGSVSMKALGEQDFNTVNKGNEQFYSQKWGDPQTLITETFRLAQTPHSDPQTRSQANVSSLAAKGDLRQRAAGSSSENSPATSPLRRSSDFYPEGAFLVDFKGDVYVLRCGQRRKLNIPVPRGISPVLVAKPDLLGIPAGEPLVSAGDIWNGSFEPDFPLAVVPSDPDMETMHASIVAAAEAPECWYLVTEGKRRKFVSAYAAECWGISSRHVHQISTEQFHSIPEGWPIIAPPQLLNKDL